MDHAGFIARSGAWVLNHFGLLMLILAICFILFHRMIRKMLPDAEIIFRWISLFALGFTGIFAFLFHVFFAETAAKAIGWQVSPFQFEVGMADLALGVLGILAFNASFGFRVATTVAAAIFLWGAALGHLYQMLKFHNFAPGNAGSWFWIDILVPLILLLCLLKLKQRKLFSY